MAYSQDMTQELWPHTLPWALRYLRLACGLLCGLFWLGLLCTAPLAYACSGGFWGDYPRERVFAVQEGSPHKNSRILPYRGQDWRIPTPSGLYDLESLGNDTLPQNEIFKALAFDLTPGTVCFTNYAGKEPWTANRVPIRACLDIRPANTPQEGEAVQVSNSAQPASELSPAAFKKFWHSLGEKTVPIDALIVEELNDRASLDLTLIRVHNSKVGQALHMDFNSNHGTLLNDSLKLSYRLRSAAWDITLSYSLPLEGPSTTAAELAQKIPLLEQSMGTWLQTFCALNALDIPSPVWSWTKSR